MPKEDIAKAPGEQALRVYLGFDVLERIHERLEREGLALSEEESLKLAYEELHAIRAEEREAAEGGPAGSAR